MSPRTALLALMALGLASPWGAGAAARAADSEAFPYTAYISSDDVQARSGPGKNYYATSKLERGAAVEVYRHDPGGWYAIRPPEGSFSWVSAKLLEIKGDGVGVVKAERVAARVGTEMSEIRDVIQVQLDEGEEVRILEARKFGTGAAAQTWYKITPPAGEFRWVFGKYVSREVPATPVVVRDARRNRLVEFQSPAEGPALEAPTDEVGEEPAESSAQRAPRQLPDVDAQPIEDEAMTERELSDDVNTTDEAAEEYAPSPAPEVRPVADKRLLTRTPLLSRRYTETRPEEPATLREETRFGRGNRPPERLASRYEGEYRGALDGEGYSDRAPERRTGSIRAMSSEEQNNEIDLLNEDLSRMVTGPANRWALTGILQRADDLTKLADTAMVRARARRLLEQAERFEDIRRRQLGVAQPSAVARHSNLPVLSNRPETTFDRLGVGSGAYARSTAPTTAAAGDRYGFDRYSPDRYADRADRYAADRPPVDRYSDPLSRAPAARGPSPLETAGRYDGTGKLTPVLSQKIGEPHFALVDERGGVRYYVTPAPGVNLRRYVGQDVGITGTRNFNPELNSEHLTARRIFPLEGARTLY